MPARPRPRRNRNRFVQIGLFIIIYTCYYALSATINPPADLADSEVTAASTQGTTVGSHKSSFVILRFLLCAHSLFQDAATEMSPPATAPTSTGLNKHGVPTLRPRRDNCTPPAIEQFPPPLMSPWLRTVRRPHYAIHISFE